MKLPVPFVQLPLLFDARALAEESDALEESLWRACPGEPPGNTELPLIAVDGDPGRCDATSGPMRATPALRRCRYLMQVLGSLQTVLGRTRLTRLASSDEARPRVDTSHYANERMRVHIPVMTHPSVRFSCGDSRVHMQAGECWMVDTWRPHCVTNETGPDGVHLVVDTAGSGTFARLMHAGRSHQPSGDDWTPRFIVPSATDPPPGLPFEALDPPSPMSYWELRDHVAFLLAECDEQPLLPLVRFHANEFVMEWRTLWFRYGTSPLGRSKFHTLLAEFLARICRLGADILLRNRTGLAPAFIGLLGDAAGEPRVDVAHPAGADGPARRVTASVRPDNDFNRPVFIVSPPRSGSSLLFETLAQGRNVCTIGGESHGIIEGNTASGVLGTAVRGYPSNRLDALDASPEVIAAVRQRFRQRVFDRDGKRVPGLIRLLEKTPKNALRIPFFTRVFPDALFIYLYRDPRQVLASMMEAWESGGFVSYPQLPGWTGLPWSMTLIPGWRALIGKPLAEVVATQWQVITDILLDDLALLPPDRWTAVCYDHLTANPDAEIRRLCAIVDFDWDRTLGRRLPFARHTVSVPDANKWRQRENDILPQLARMSATLARAERCSHKNRAAP